MRQARVCSPHLERLCISHPQLIHTDHTCAAPPHCEAALQFIPELLPAVHTCSAPTL